MKISECLKHTEKNNNLKTFLEVKQKLTGPKNIRGQTCISSVEDFEHPMFKCGKYHLPVISWQVSVYRWRAPEL